MISPVGPSHSCHLHVELGSQDQAIATEEQNQKTTQEVGFVTDTIASFQKEAEMLRSDLETIERQNVDLKMKHQVHFISCFGCVLGACSLHLETD